jgi:hypothetical protein
MGVRQLIDAALEQGCEHRVSKISVVSAGIEIPVKYLYNPRTGGTYDISDLEEDESVGISSIRAAERRLGIVLIKP